MKLLHSTLVCDVNKRLCNIEVSNSWNQSPTSVFFKGNLRPVLFVTFLYIPIYFDILLNLKVHVHVHVHDGI